MINDDGGDASADGADVVRPPNDVRSEAAVDVTPPEDVPTEDATTDASEDTMTPDASMDDASAPDAAVEDTSAPDASTPDASMPDASMPDASMPDASMPDASTDDGGSDASMDAGDAGADAGPDVAEDSAADAAVEGGADAGAEAGAGGYMVVRNATGASCDDTTSWTDTGLVGDDRAMGAPAALPFSFGYFGSTATHWSASTNGFAQLWPSASGTPSSEYSNVSLPSASAPRGALAVFWDDLLVSPGALVQYATLGSAPSRRFVIDWRDVDTIDEAQLLHFQIKLFETTNVIEFHYCSMDTLEMDERHTGESATIGVQDFSGTNAAQVAFNTAGTTPTGTWFRFVPR
jgi:hypothetical protein